MESAFVTYIYQPFFNILVAIYWFLALLSTVILAYQNWLLNDAGGGEAFFIWSYSSTAYEEVVQTIRNL